MPWPLPKIHDKGDPNHECYVTPLRLWTGNEAPWITIVLLASALPHSLYDNRRI